MMNVRVVVATLPASSQAIVLLPSVLNHLARHRQTNWWKCEAGGQLFGRVTHSVLEIELATGPYRGDYRSRFGYRSSPEIAQREIEKRRAIGLYYCGEWHTHPERHPTASAEDLRTVSKLVALSDLRLSSVVMVIQGTEMSANGLAVYSSDGDVLVRWDTDDGPEEIVPSALGIQCGERSNTPVS